MIGCRWLIVAGLVTAGAACARGEPADDGPVEWLARCLSPEYRRTESRLTQLDRELGGLPAPLPRPIASRYGFRSENLIEQDKPQWVQIDLTRSRKIDRLAVVPVHIPNIGVPGAGYGFPLRFRIEVSDDPQMVEAVTVVNQTAADVVNPGLHPMVFRIPPVQGRYVRFTSTRHFPVEEGFIWALEEIVVLSGNQTIGLDKPTTASSSLELYPNWSAQRINDGMSALGLPVTIEKSPSHGYLSAVTNNPQERKWLRIDFGRDYRIDEIRLVPVEPGSFEALGMRAFPRGWGLELATDSEFQNLVWDVRIPSSNLVGFPGSCAVVVPVPARSGRYLRLVTDNLWGTGDECGYGLAEIQAYAGNENVALAKPVTASDASGPAPGWAPAFVTDGFGSRHPLIELPEFLDLIERRGLVEDERDRLLASQQRKVRATGLILGYGGSGIGVLTVLGWGWLLVRQRTVRRQGVALLREQIARDLHDDIGSNLGGIVLVSEIGSKHSADPQARADFLAIKEAADEASASMHDIVWLIQSGHYGLRDLVTKMRHSARMILGDKNLFLEVEPTDLSERTLSLLFRRHVFFAFKETLNNIRKHAQAGKIEVTIRLDSSHLTWIIRDDGIGFDLQAAEQPGHGLSNLKRRAARLKGNCYIESQRGRGSVVTFSAPLKS